MTQEQGVIIQRQKHKAIKKLRYEEQGLTRGGRSAELKATEDLWGDKVAVQSRSRRFEVMPIGFVTVYFCTFRTKNG